MEILVYVIVYGIGLAISTAILAASLFLVEDSKTGSFSELGVAPTLARCATICLGTTLLGLIPGAGLLLALVGWFVGIMFLFQKTFGQAFILALINGIFSLGVTGGLEFILRRWLGGD